MTVRGGKNRVLIYTGAGLLLVALVLFYHNAATRLDEARTKYDRCHLSEESLSAQLQVILEYKTRLEKSLQQEKSDHAQTKEEMRNKAEEERQTRERENLESINKFTTLQQEYKLLQSQHEDVTQELEKAKQQLLTGEEERSQLDTQVTQLTQQVKLLTQEKNGDAIVLQTKLKKLQEDYDKLKSDGSERLLKEKADLQRELAECLRNHSSTKQKTGGDDGEGESNKVLPVPSLARRAVVKSSTAANKVEVVSGAVHFNTSTPMVNPDAVQSQDATAPGAGAQVGKLLRIPAVPDYKQQQQNNFGGPELDKPPHSADAAPDKMAAQLPQAPPLVNIIPRNQPDDLHYEDDLANKKGEEEDDDVGDDYPVDKDPEPAKAPPRGIILNHPPHDGVMILPK